MPLAYEGWDIHKTMRNSGTTSQAPDAVAYDMTSNNGKPIEGKRGYTGNVKDLEIDLKNNVKDTGDTAVYVL